MLQFIKEIYEAWRTNQALDALDRVHTAIAMERGYENWKRDTESFYLQRRKEIIERKGKMTDEEKAFEDECRLFMNK